MIPMSDGVDLAANITLPSDTGSYPVILARTPYGKDNEDDGGWGEHWADQGYAFVLQDCRGSGNSGGDWNPFKAERRDGTDTRAWILKQSWCDGSLGLIGGSYLGYTQFWGSLDEPAGIRAMFAEVPAMDWYSDVTYIDGALSVGTAIGWSLEMADPSVGEGAFIDWENWNEDRVYRTLPLIDFDGNISIRLEWLRDMIKHPSYGEYWQSTHIDTLKRNCKLPLVTVSGWYDIFITQALDYHADAILQGKPDQHLIIGPWTHGINWVEGEREIPDNHEYDFELLQIGWYDHWLRNAPKTFELAPIRLYVMGANEWRDEFEWPLARTEYRNLYLHSDGLAHLGEGTLSWDGPDEESEDHFIYDPDNPVPTHGGALLFDMPGCWDQRDVEEREDVLVYTSDILEQALEVTGNIRVILYAATDGRDTDWTAKLVDVYPDGRAFNLCDGVIRARYREGVEKQVLIEPNDVYEYEIDLWATSNVFMPGHRIRLEISSSNFPRIDRNPNTGNPFGLDNELRIAEQTIFHDAEHPSRLVLPVIPTQ